MEITSSQGNKLTTTEFDRWYQLEVNYRDAAIDEEGNILAVSIERRHRHSCKDMQHAIDRADGYMSNEGCDVTSHHLKDDRVKNGVPVRWVRHYVGFSVFEAIGYEISR